MMSGADLAASGKYNRKDGNWTLLKGYQIVPGAYRVSRIFDSDTIGW